MFYAQLNKKICNVIFARCYVFLNLLWTIQSIATNSDEGNICSASNPSSPTCDEASSSGILSNGNHIHEKYIKVQIIGNKYMCAVVRLYLGLSNIPLRHPMHTKYMKNRFRTVVFDMIEKWSLGYVNGIKEIQRKPNIQLGVWTSAYTWAKSNIPIQTIQNDQQIAYIMPTNSKNTDVIDENKSWISFDEFKSKNFAYVRVEFPKPYTKDNWLEGKCTCAQFMKNFICMHVLGVSLRMKFITAPDAARNLPLGQKRKRGRPDLAKTALVYQ